VEELLTLYWQQVIGGVVAIYFIAKLRTEVDSLKEKVKTLFDLFNNSK